MFDESVAQTSTALFDPTHLRGVSHYHLTIALLCLKRYQQTIKMFSRTLFALFALVAIAAVSAAPQGLRSVAIDEVRTVAPDLNRVHEE